MEVLFDCIDRKAVAYGKHLERVSRQEGGGGEKKK